MPIPVEVITAQQAQRLLALEEGHFADLKAKDIQPAKLGRTISAFANADGGDVYIGIREQNDRSRHWDGFPTVEAANGHLQAFEALFPLGAGFEYSMLSCEGMNGLVLHVEVSKALDIRTASGGTPYLRRGAQNLPVDTAEAIQRLRLNKGLASFENELVNCELPLLTNSEPALAFMLAVIPSSEPERWFRKQQLIRSERPTAGGVLLFAEVPQALLPKRCGVKIYRYKTNDKEGTRETLAGNPISIEGHLYEQIHAAVAATVSIIESIAVLGEEGFETVKYPSETLHEIITNAVLHRDYSVADDIHVRIFDNRVEVQSPGVLPGHVTVANILDERFARNGNVVRIINKFPDPPNKDVGEGLNTAFAAMRKLGLKEPIIEQQESSVLVVIRHEPLASPEEIVMEYLEAAPSINNSKGRDICHIGSENVMKRVFERLIERQLIERVPESRGRATAYQKRR